MCIIKIQVMTEISDGVHYLKLRTHNFPEAGFPFSGATGKWETLLWWRYEKESISLGLNQETWSIALSRSKATSKISVTVILSVTNSLSADQNIHDNTNINLMIKSDLYQFNPISIFTLCVIRFIATGPCFRHKEVYSFRNPKQNFVLDSNQSNIARFKITYHKTLLSCQEQNVTKIINYICIVLCYSFKTKLNMAQK